MANRGDFEVVNAANVKTYVGKKSQKRKKNSKKDELLFELTPSDVITTHSLSSTEVSDE